MTVLVLVTDDDRRWARDRDDHGWVLPPPGPAWTRWPLVRTFRAFVAVIRVERHAAAWGSLGFLDSGYDAWVVYAIARGWA